MDSTPSQSSLVFRTPVKSSTFNLDSPPHSRSLFSTPRHRKTPVKIHEIESPIPRLRFTPTCLWPRLSKKISLELLSNVTEEIFGYKPHEWQLTLTERILEGHDCIGIAGTGSGKSLIFAMLALVAELSQESGMIVVISPLKSLQKDQVRRFNQDTVFTSKHTAQKLRISAVTINEDNCDEAAFQALKTGTYRICYASPEILLRSQAFKQLFRDGSFRQRLIAVIVDEAHVIEEWKDSFRKDYGELEVLRILVGSEIPWVGLTGTCSTRTFEIIYKSLGMGGNRPFYGLDLGSNRPNLALWVRPMEYPVTSMADLLAFIPEAPKGADDFPKTIFYLKTRQQVRVACQLCRAAVGSQFNSLMLPFTAVFSEYYKDTAVAQLRDGTVKWFFSTVAGGMGVDIPDIEQVVIFGVDSFSSAFQKGGRAGRDQSINARMIWIVEPWAFNQQNESINPPSKQELNERKLRETMDQDSRTFINLSQSANCMREFAFEHHFRPRPRIPGFPWYEPQPGEVDDDISRFKVHWYPLPQVIKRGAGCGCSARVCRPDPEKPVGLLTPADHEHIQHHCEKLGIGKIKSAMTNATTSSSTHPNAPQTQIRCSKAEREMLQEAIWAWRDQEWAKIRHDYPFYCSEWVLTSENISRLVDKAHILINAISVDDTLLKNIISKAIYLKPAISASLITLLEEFREDHRQRHSKENAEHQPKRSNQASAVQRTVNEAGSVFFQWQVQGYHHEQSNLYPSEIEYSYIHGPF